MKRIVRIWSSIHLNRIPRAWHFLDAKEEQKQFQWRDHRGILNGPFFLKYVSKTCKIRMRNPMRPKSPSAKCHTRGAHHPGQCIAHTGNAKTLVGQARELPNADNWPIYHHLKEQTPPAWHNTFWKPGRQSWGNKSCDGWQKTEHRK